MGLFYQAPCVSTCACMQKDRFMRVLLLVNGSGSMTYMVGTTHSCACKLEFVLRYRMQDTDFDMVTITIEITQLYQTRYEYCPAGTQLDILPDLAMEGSPEIE